MRTSGERSTAASLLRFAAMARCDECGFDSGETEPDELVDQLRGFSRRYRIPRTRLLSGEDPEVIVRSRPTPVVWSALEDAAHTRDSFGFYGRRIDRVLTEHHPQSTSFDFDATCEQARYNEQDVSRGLEDLAVAVETLVARVAIDKAACLTRDDDVRGRPCASVSPLST